LTQFAKNNTSFAGQDTTLVNEDTSLVILLYVSPFARWYSAVIVGAEPTNCPIITVL
jgi:hypothetical protein